METACAAKTYQVTPQDMPLSCPTDDMTLWNAHPKVYLSFDAQGHAQCPYCGSKFSVINEQND